MQLSPKTSIVDTTKLRCFLKCPRAFFFEHVLGWRAEQPNIHLSFGHAWHKGMQVLLESRSGATMSGYRSEAVECAQRTFAASFPSELDTPEGPKNLGNGVLALGEYVARYADDAMEPLYVEVAGCVPVAVGKPYYFKIDGIIKTENGIFVLEHKTTSRLDSWMASKWTFDLQVLAYINVLYNLFPEEEVGGAFVNMAVLRKGTNEFHRYEVRPTLKGMQVWKDTVEYYLSLLEINYEELDQADENEDTLRAFPQNPEACIQYGLCQWHPYCGAWPNPLQRCAQPPLGYTVHFWDPREEEAKWLLEDGELKQEVREEKGEEDA